MHDDSASLVAAMQRTLGETWSVQRAAASGFCDTWRARSARATWFVKSVPTSRAHVLEAEADGLRALESTRTLRVPQVHACWRDESADLAVLAVEWLELHPPAPGFGTRFGQALAALHAAAVDGDGDGRFGWHIDNRIGATLQTNRWSASDGTAGWIEFFARERLGAMRDRLAAAGAPPALTDEVDRVVQALPDFFGDGHVARPSLIHGDLWSGNWASLADGTPVVYDPAVSCSDAEAELAMLELFGAPPVGFWPAYRDAGLLSRGYAQRRPLYQLYHLLNHALLFGGGYLVQSLEVARRLARPSRQCGQ